MQQMHQWPWHQQPLVPHSSESQNNIQGKGAMDSPPGPHLCADSAFAGDLVGKTPLGIALKHVLRCPLEVSCTQAVVAYRDSVIYNSHSLPHWYFLGSHAK